MARITTTFTEKKVLIEVKQRSIPKVVREDVLYEDRLRKGGLGNFIKEQFFAIIAQNLLWRFNMMMKLVMSSR